MYGWSDDDFEFLEIGRGAGVTQGVDSLRAFGYTMNRDNQSQRLLISDPSVAVDGGVVMIQLFLELGTEIFVDHFAPVGWPNHALCARASN